RLRHCPRQGLLGNAPTKRFKSDQVRIGYQRQNRPRRSVSNRMGSSCVAPSTLPSPGASRKRAYQTVQIGPSSNWVSTSKPAKALGLKQNGEFLRGAFDIALARGF